MAHTLCSNIATHGPFNQYIFLGCSVESFTINIGLNEQQSELSVELVEDCASVPDGGNAKLFYDSSLNSSSTTGADPGFLNPAVGSPVYFRIGGSEFSGIIQAWTKKNSESGKPKYSVRVTDPRQILEGTQIIINNYSGGVGSCYNLINAFGFMEQFGATCVPAPFEPTCSETFGDALGFGGSGANEEGMQWNQLKLALSMLLGGYPSLSNIYSPYGRLVFKGPSNSGYGLMPADYNSVSIIDSFGGGFHDGNVCYYSVDLSELPSLPDDYRISGDSIGLMDVITQVCDAASHDYYIELLPIQNSQIKIIKIRTISRASQPLLTTLSTYVTDNGVIDSSIGHELRNETTTVFLSGAHKESFLEVSTGSEPEGDCFPGLNDSEVRRISPFMGLKANGDVITYTDDADGFHEWDGFDVRGLKGILEGAIGAADSIMINEKEIRCALTGFDSWCLYARNINTELYQVVDPNQVFNAAPILQQFGFLIQNPKALNPLQKAFNWLGLGNANAAAQKLALRNLQKGFKFISAIAEKYGVTFMVMVPDSCVKQNAATGEIEYSHSPTDSAWTDDLVILGLDKPSDELDKFSTEDGKIKPMIQIDNLADEIDLDVMEADQFVKIGDDLILPVTVEPDYVFLDKSELCSPRVVFSYGSRLKKRDGIINQAGQDKALGGFLLVVQGVHGVIQDKAALEKACRNAGNFGVEFAMYVPDVVIIPMKSNINRYGPWITAGPPGLIRFEINDDLAPWNYGSSELMCAAGDILSTDGVSFQQAVEVGSITVPGFPTYNGGAEFGSPVGGKNLIENRSIITTGFSGVDPSGNTINIDYLGVESEIGAAWGGTYGPIITDISVSVGPSGIQTTYTFRTYTSKSGKLNKNIIDRMKRNNLLTKKLNKKIRDFKKLEKFGLLGAPPKNAGQQIANGLGAAIKEGGNALIKGVGGLFGA